jgi:hypothetical protein
LNLNTRLGWKGLPGTNTIPYYRNRKLTAVISLMIQAPGVQKFVTAMKPKLVIDEKTKVEQNWMTIFVRNRLLLWHSVNNCMILRKTVTYRYFLYNFV